MQTEALVLADRLKSEGKPEQMIWDRIELTVTDLDRSQAFWTDILGFQAHERTDEYVVLGTTERALVILHGGAKRPVQRGYAGLYHVAFALPEQAEFSRIFARLVAANVKVAPVDHLMSKGLYLSDPDGHGVEFGLETPERFGAFKNTPQGLAMIDADGRQRSGRDALDIRTELALASNADLKRPLPDGTSISHVHLHVPALDPAIDWFERLGFTRNLRLPAMGLSDMGAGGSYTHRLAVNIWAGPNVKPAPADSARLLRYCLKTRTQTPTPLLHAQSLSTEVGPDPAGIEVSLEPI